MLAPTRRVRRFFAAFFLPAFFLPAFFLPTFFLPAFFFDAFFLVAMNPPGLVPLNLARIAAFDYYTTQTASGMIAAASGDDLSGHHTLQDGTRTTPTNRQP